MKSKLTYLTLALLALAGALFILTRSPEDVSADSSLFSEPTLEYLRRAQSEIFNEDWEAFNRLDESSADVPYGFVTLMRAAQLQAEMFSREERFAEEWMYSTLDSASSYFTDQMSHANRTDSARILYCLAVAESHRALWDAKFGSFIAAIKKGYAGRDLYEQGLALDSAFSENKIGLGAFLYWKSAKAGGALRSIGVVSDEREAGLRMLRQGISGAVISPDVGKSSLIWILLHEKEYDEVVALAEELAAKYPHGAPFLWPLAEACKESHKYSRALEVYLELREKLLRDPGNQMNLIKVDYEITLLARLLEDDLTLARIEKSFDEYSENTPRETRQRMEFEYRALKRL